MHKSPPTLLSGRVVLPDGGARQRYLLIRDGVIQWISRSRPPSSFVAGAREVVTGHQDWIFPGLIDLHSHPWYNMLPLWRSVRAPFDNRHVWRNDDDYKASVSGVLGKVRGEIKARKVFSELQAVAGGTTVLDEPKPLDAETTQGPTLLCRDTGSSSDLGLPADTQIRSVVDFFKPGEDGLPKPAPGRGGDPPPLEAYVGDRKQLQAVLVHVAEGRSGFGSHRGVDPYSRAEFEALMNHPAMEDVEAVRKSNVSIVHGCGIEATNPRHIDFLLERDIAVIWSPASNMLLYDDTIDVQRLIAAGITVALGSDWSPSGSKHVWEEAKFARFFLHAIGADISDADVFKMVTTNPGRCLGLPRLGRIEEEALADFFILRSPIESDSALEVFFSTTDRDVLATIVDGLPIYGDRRFLSGFDVELQALPRREGTAVANKAVHIPTSIGLDNLAEGIDAVEDRLKELGSYRSNLLAESDMPYRRSFQMLRSRVERFGWSVRRTRKVGPSAKPGRVLAPPAAAFLRVGFQGETGEEEFLASLGETVLPATAALGQGLRLSAFLAGIAPGRAPQGCPDVISVSFYQPSAGRRRDYKAMLKDCLGGRCSELIQQTAFARTWVAQPVSYSGSPASDRVYHLLEDAVDWGVGQVRLVLASRKRRSSVEDFHGAVQAAFDSLSASPSRRDGVLAALGDDWAAFWEHASDGEPLDDEYLSHLQSSGRLLLNKQARPVEAKATLGDRWNGFKVARGDCLRVAFERLDLMPW